MPTEPRWIVGPVFDAVFLLGSPLLAIVVGWILSGPWGQGKVVVFGKPMSRAFLLWFTLAQAHLLPTFVRTHLNPVVRARHPIRFWVVPPLLFTGLLWSPWLFALSFPVMVLWDTYHSSMQTFGIGRIYDRREGNDPEAGRALDLGINLLLYAGPFFAGVHFLGQVRMSTEKFRGLAPMEIGGFILDAALFQAAPARVEALRLEILLALGISGVVFLPMYLWGYWRLGRRGYRTSWRKAVLFASTATASAAAWGFNAFGVGMMVMNLFHAIQYYALIGVAERGTLATLSPGVGGGSVPGLLLVLLGPTLAVGFLFATVEAHGVAVLLTTCTLLHFWYDGFIWSVRKDQHLEARRDSG